MEKLFVDKWFKLPPKEKLNDYYVIKFVKKGTGRKRAKSRQKAKKKTS